MKLIISKKHLKIFMAAVVMVLGFMLWDSTSMAFSVKVTGDAVNIRSKADATSEIVANVKSGATFEGSAEETGADGKVWYKISINNGTGYIRSDFAQKSDGDAAASVPETVVTPIDNQSATIVNDNTNVRKQASTDAGKVATVKQGVAVTITGTATGTDNKTWYQVKFINNGSEVTGFVRYDLVKIGEGEAAPEATEGEAPADEVAAEEALEDVYADMPAEEPVSSNDDYEMVYTAGNDGVEAWYVYDHIENRRMKLDDLLAAESINANNMEIMEGKVSSMKVAVIVLAVLLVLALGAAAFFGLKWHESLDDYDDEDDDDDEDDEDDDDDFEEPKPVRRKVAEKPQSKKSQPSQPARRQPQRQPQRQQERQPQRSQQERQQQRPQPAKPQGERKPMVNADGVPMKRVRMADGSIKLVPADKIRVKARPAEEARVSDEAARRPQPAKDNWKSKNFLTEDEDLEFSFINDEE